MSVNAALVRFIYPAKILGRGIALNGVVPTPADAADALALAICHCWRAPMIARMAAAEALAAQHRQAYAAKVKAAR